MNPCVACNHLAFRNNVNWPTKTIPDGRVIHLACAFEVEHAVESVTNNATRSTEGVWRWNSNNNCIPDNSLRNAGFVSDEDRDATAAVRDVEQRQAIQRYREQRTESGYSDEEMFEMRAAFGEGTEVVDVFTGQTITV